jgi:hypothetical protein
MGSSMGDSEKRFGEERRSGIDTRSQAERQLIGERRSGMDRRIGRPSPQGCPKPSDERLALFARRLRRALSDKRSRDLFGIANGEDNFSVHADVLRTIEWIESLVGADNHASAPTMKSEEATLRRPRPQHEA